MQFTKLKIQGNLYSLILRDYQFYNLIQLYLASLNMKQKNSQFKYQEVGVLQLIQKFQILISIPLQIIHHQYPSKQRNFSIFIYKTQKSETQVFQTQCFLILHALNRRGMISLLIIFNFRIVYLLFQHYFYFQTLEETLQLIILPLILANFIIHQSQIQLIKMLNQNYYLIKYQQKTLYFLIQCQLKELIKQPYQSIKFQ
ncbi:unnamed protein product [Paramecium sonneborni]|uniref:Transmembrane protein n=1 Tax=Paramecium sonneborni TaxID=65129 RepID=A0A8S1RD52_9CILI|nr:unnamed protein product [Paramecium sonneborni]